jgi:hypothetical protein
VTESKVGGARGRFQKVFTEIKVNSTGLVLLIPTEQSVMYALHYNDSGGFGTNIIMD